MNRKKIYKSALACLLLVGVIAFVAVLTASWQPNIKADNEAWVEIDVSSMRQGEAIAVEGFHLVYRSDETGDSEKDFLVFWAYAPTRKCPVSLVLPGQIEYQRDELKIFSGVHHFRESCDGAIWNPDGSHVKGTGHPKEADLKKGIFKPFKPGAILIRRAKV